MSPNVKTVTDILLHSALLFLLLGSLFTIGYGVSLLLKLRWVHALNDRMNRWVSSREALRPMEVSRDVDRFVYRWNLRVGMLLALGSAFVLYVAFFGPEAAAIARLFPARASVWGAMLVQGLRWIVVLGSVAGLVSGIVLVVRPGLLRSAGAVSNRSYSERRATKLLEVMNISPDRWIMSSPRLSGAIIVVCSVYVALVIGHLLKAGL